MLAAVIARWLRKPPRSRSSSERRIVSLSRRRTVLILASITTACTSVPDGPRPTVAALTFATVPVCYDYGCRTRASFTLRGEYSRALEDLFTPPAGDAVEERQRIRAAIALLETAAGEQTPIHRDRGGNPWNQRGAGRMDCIDESINTTVFLRLLAQHDMLQWHRVEDRAYRAPRILDQHFAAQITEIATGTRYAVDSWHLDNGHPPFVQRLEDWSSKRAFDTALNPPLSPHSTPDDP